MNKRILFAVAAILPFVFLVRCGGDDSADPGGTAGSGAGGDADASMTGSGGSGGSNTGTSGAGGANTGTGGAGEAGPGCRLVGATCASNADCCTVNCDPQMKICAVSTPGCQAAGSTCTVPQDCCTFVCTGGKCGSTQCTSDNQACSSDAQCCGGKCAAGADGGAMTCVPLNSCRTTGNSCTTHDQCCSKLCNNGSCSPNGSFCTVTGNVCATGAECCGGFCTKAQGATVGVCDSPHPPGVPGCMVAGDVCGGNATSDGGVVMRNDAGVPACGGECCSRACAPYKGGVLICQPPSGCRPTGEACRADADCCGFGGIQGDTGVGNCSKANPNDAVGRCDNGNACRPAGAICKIATMSCNAENNCCAGNVNQNPLVCQQDILGIPRCMMKGGESCADAGSRSGQACATSVDCCGLPCVPNPAFTSGPDAGSTPPFVCGGICVGYGGACTTGADCCPGLPCVMTPGSTRGTCGAPPPPPPPDAGPPPADAGVPDVRTDAPQGCTQYGQICTMAGECCDGVPCSGGRCLIVVN